MTESRIEKLTRIGQEMAAAVDEMRAEAVDLTPDLTTKLANRQIEGEAAWWRSVGHGRSASRTFDSMTGDSQQAVRTGVERVLAHLASTNRLIPAGGMALTAEQVEDVRKVLGKATTEYGAMELTAAWARLRALFPATEPAEDLRVHNHTPYRGPGPDGHCAEHAENGRLRGQCMADTAPTVGRCPKELEGDIESFPCVLSAGHRERCKSAGGLTWGYFAPAEPAEEAASQAGQTAQEGAPSHDRIAAGCKIRHACASASDPARRCPICEPAEEETKAEDESGWHWVQSAGGYYSGPACTGGYGCRSMAHYEGCLRPSLTASSPVVPAPTETGPWQTWQEVPEGVKYESGAKHWGAARKYLNRSGVRMAVVNGEEYPSTTDESKIQGLAPFVAAEEG